MIPLSEAVKAAVDVCAWLTVSGITFDLCGDVRRGKDPVRCVDVLVSVREPRLGDLLAEHADARALPRKRGTVGSVLFHDVPFNFYYSSKDSWGAALLSLTGSGLFNVVLRGMARKQRYKLNAQGLWFGEDQIAGKTEEQIFHALGLEWLDPKEREVTAANKRRRWLKRREVV